MLTLFRFDLINSNLNHPQLEQMRADKLPDVVRLRFYRDHLTKHGQEVVFLVFGEENIEIMKISNKMA